MLSAFPVRAIFPLISSAVMATNQPYWQTLYLTAPPIICCRNTGFLAAPTDAVAQRNEFDRDAVYDNFRIAHDRTSQKGRFWVRVGRGREPPADSFYIIAI